jgi:hypothetical protein
MDHDKSNGKTFDITIDDEPYEVPREDQLVADLIRLTGADPAITNLVEVKGRNQIPLNDNDKVKVSSGSKFVTVSTEPTPVA